VVGAFALERFFRLSPRSTAGHKAFLPTGELLFRPEDGTPAESFFKRGLRSTDDIITTDLIIFKQAIDAHLQLGEPVSINLSAETFCDERFLSTVEDALATCPDLNPYYVCLEITEQGGVPENFNPKAFEKLIKLGFTMALDDYDPRQESEQARLRTFSPFISIIKLPFELMQFARTDLESLAETCRMIGDIKTLYPDIQLVMEGVRKTDNHLLGVLEAFGVDVVQITRNTETGISPARACPS
jgi:EAL domain-containing protein (putative c-di-GMP-specific phosphodiesterase class I)